MTNLTQLPEVLRVEVKFTTSSTVSLPDREHAALLPENEEQVGILACLFWSRGSDGHWLLVDQSSPALRSHTNLSQQTLEALAKTSKNLEALRNHVNRYWCAFLEKNIEGALSGHEDLSQRLSRQFEDGTLLQSTDNQILMVEHAASMERLLDKHGEKQVGIIFQNLLCYLLAAAGYTRVQNNPIGVPDVMLSSPLGRSSGHDRFELTVRRKELEALITYCHQLNDTVLAATLSRVLQTDSEAVGRTSRQGKR